MNDCDFKDVAHGLAMLFNRDPSPHKNIFYDKLYNISQWDGHAQFERKWDIYKDCMVMQQAANNMNVSKSTLDDFRPHTKT